MFLCRISVRCYSSSANSVFKPINFKHKPKFDEITEPFKPNRNKKYDNRSQSSRDGRGDRRSRVTERDGEGLTVITTPLEPSYRSEDSPRDWDHDGRRGSSTYQTNEDDSNVEDLKEKHFDRRRRTHDDRNGYGNRGNHDDDTGYRSPGKYEDGNDYRNRGNHYEGNGYRSRGNHYEGNGYRSRGNYDDGTGYRNQGNYDDGTGYRSRGNYDDGNGYSKRGNHDEGYGYKNQGNREDDQGRFRNRQFDDHKPKRFDSRYSNEFKKGWSENRLNTREFTTRKFDSRYDKKENRNHYAKDSQNREHRGISDSNTRMKLDANNLRNIDDKSEFGSNEHFNENKDESLSMLSQDSSLLEDVENVFGIHPVLLALRAGKRTIHKIFCKQGIEKMNPKIKEIYELAADKKIAFVSVKGFEIKKVFKGDTVHQGIFCLASPLPVSVFNIDDACQDLSSLTLTASESHGSAMTGYNDSCSEEFQHNPLNDTLNEESLNLNQILQNADVASLSSVPRTLSHQMSLESEMLSAQSSSKLSLEVEPADIIPTTTETTTDSTGHEVSPSNPQSAVAGEFITIQTPLSTQALSSAVAIAASRPEQDGNGSEEQDGNCGAKQDCSNDAEKVAMRGAEPLIAVASSEPDLWSTGKESQEQSKPQLWLLLDSVTDAMNVGAVLRSCCYFGVSRVLFTPSCADISPVVSKASSGAAELLSLSLVPQPGRTLADLRERGWKVLVAVSREAESPQKPHPLHRYAMTGNTVLVVGSESSGVSVSISEQADAAVTIPATGPLAGALGCLNVSVAAAITLHALTAGNHQDFSGGKASWE